MNLTQEQKLQTFLNEISGRNSGYIASHIFISKISQQNRSPQKVKVIMSIIEKSLIYTNSEVFAMGNSDIIVIAKGTLLKNIYNTIEEIKNLFSNDPVVVNDYDNNFSKIYSFDFQYEDFERSIKNIINATDMGGGNINNSMPALTPKNLGELALQIESANIEPSIRKQEVIAIGSENIGKIFFQEFYISLKRLKKILNVNVNLQSDKWLFQHFSEILDRKMLVTLSRLNLQYKNDISLNLNLRTIETPEFKEFIKKYNRSLIVEFQISDVFEDISYYEKIKNKLHLDGHKIAIDSVNDEMLRLLDLNLLQPDYVKMIYSNSYYQQSQNVTELREIIKTIGSDKFILCRCPGEEAIKWGLEREISIYQGYFVDMIIGMMIKKQCGKGSKCDVNDCVYKRHFVDSKMKIGCSNIDHLDSIPNINLGAVK